MTVWPQSPPSASPPILHPHILSAPAEEAGCLRKRQVLSHFWASPCPLAWHAPLILLDPGPRSLPLLRLFFSSAYCNLLAASHQQAVTSQVQSRIMSFTSGPSPWGTVSDTQQAIWHVAEALQIFIRFKGNIPPFSVKITQVPD